MKFKFSKGVPYMLAVLLAGVGIFSCRKPLQLEPKSNLTTSQVYRNVFDADAAVIGLYGKLMGLSKQYVVLNELRADLMEVTDNADPALREINTHSVTANNPYADPRPFFSLINDCNDVLKNFNIMLQQNKFKVDEYNQRYSDVGALRSWLYLQLGIHYNNVPYVTNPLETVDAVRDQSKYPVIPFDQLLDSLISFTESLPFLKPYLPGGSLVVTIDASQTSRFFIEKNVLLGDLHLWKGNYRKAATYYRALMESTGYFNDNVATPLSAQQLDQFKISSFSDNNVSYIRFQEQDIRSLIESNTSGWRAMFSRPQDANWRNEWIWVLPFNSNFSPVNPFVDLFSNVAGSYLVKPSQQAIDNWNSQLQTNGFPYDQRGPFTYKTINGQQVIMKYLYQSVDPISLLPANPLIKNGQWFLSRASAVHLHFAEAANRDGRNRLAYALVNTGIAAAYPLPTGITDPTNYQQTADAPPYDFDARTGGAQNYHGYWTRNEGIRNHGAVVANTVVGDSTLSIENSIITEEALELAYEGYRWPDLLRIARRRNDPSILANAVYAKLKKDGNSQADDVKNKLMKRENWYLPFKWQ